MIPSSNLLQFIFLIPILLIALIFLSFVVIPYTKLQLFKKKGMTFFFFPVLGYLRNWFLGYKDNGDYFNRFKLASKLHSDDRVLLSHLGKDPLILLRDTQLIKDYYQKQHLYEKVGVPDYLKPVIGAGLLLAEGDMWKQHRKIISGSFNYEALKHKTELVQATTRELLDRIGSEGSESFRTIHNVQEITGEVVGRIFFGEHLSKYSLDNKPLTIFLAELLTELAMITLSAPGLLLGPKLIHFTPRHRQLMKKTKKLREICAKIIEDRKAQGENKENDLLASLLKTQNAANPEDRMSDIEIVNEFITFFAAGMDTTGHLIGMTLYMLTQYPEYIEKFKKEREAHYKADEKANMDNINKMGELHCFLKEVLRFHTPVPLNLDRIALKDHKIGDLDIPKGMWVKPDYYAMLFHEKHWTEPEKFNPERWKGDAEKVDSYAYTPFSAGPRNCIGQHLAMMEAKIIISEFLEMFDFKLKDGDEYKLKMVYRLLNEPEVEPLLILKRR